MMDHSSVVCEECGSQTAVNGIKIEIIKIGNNVTAAYPCGRTYTSPAIFSGERMIEEYSMYLDRDFSVDYWSDEGIGYAITLLENFTDVDWIALKNIARHKPALWMIRCAETLGDVGEIRSLDVLLELTAVENDEVKISALDSINSGLFLGVNLDERTEMIHSAIKVAKHSAGTVASIMLASLEKRLTEE